MLKTAFPIQTLKSNNIGWETAMEILVLLLRSEWPVRIQVLLVVVGKSLASQVEHLPSRGGKEFSLNLGLRYQHFRLAQMSLICLISCHSLPSGRKIIALNKVVR